MNSDKARRIRVHPVLAYPVVTVALVVSVALALTPFGTSQVMALGAATIPMETTAPTATGTSSPSTTTPTPAETTAPSATSTTTPSPVPVPSGSAAAAPGDHHVLARIDGSSLQVNYLPVDDVLADAAHFQTFRVRFQMHNAGIVPMTVNPRLEYRPESGSGYAAVPEKALTNVPFHVTREWVPNLGLSGGTMPGPLGDDIAVSQFVIGDQGGLAVNGHHSMGANPDQPITLPSDSYTEQEFTVSVTIDAQYLTVYELRITNGGKPLTGTDVATIHVGATPALVLAPGQHQGIDVGGPQPAKDAGVVAANSAFPAIFAVSSSAAPASSSVVAAASATVADVSAVDALSGPKTVRYPLNASTLTAAAVFSADVHGPYTTTSGQCAICHRAHTAKAPNLLDKRSPTNLGSQSTLCLSCHDGTGANSNVQTQYDLTGTVNNAETREYYSHDAVDSTPLVEHTQSQLNEFGSVDGGAPPLNRHSECSDCHNPHQATATPSRDSAQFADGWDVNRLLAGVSGVSVLNGAAGSTPTYTFLSGVDTDLVPDTDLVTREYQLCFKCHSGSTQLPPPIAGQPSKDFLDKGVEFNPANPSFHPIEAMGRNQTPKMLASLKGASEYKLWDFDTTSTIRCLNCHASSTASGPNPPLTVDPTLPMPGSALAPHASANRGILLRNYRDRVLKPASEGFLAKDFALCLVCHADAPFKPNAPTTATNFKYHELHLNYLTNKSSGPTAATDIDKPGDGVGNAICAECHFRLHSTTNQVGEQTLTFDPISGSRLVNFAPNVTKYGTTPISWSSTGTGSGSCSLTCHGKEHTPETYSP